MADPNRCPKCGGYKKPQFDLCYKCDQEKKGFSRSSQTLPADAVFQSFYVSLSSDNLRPEIFLEKSREIAERLGRAKTSQKSIRTLLNLLKAAEWNIKTKPKDADDQARETFARFIMFTERQVKRGIVNRLFLDLVVGHRNYVKNAREFKGFVEYLTAIYAYLPKS